MGDAEPFDKYELRILDDATGDEVWKTGRLLRSGAVVSLRLPASVFELRRYRLLLSGLMDGERTDLKEGYLLSVRMAFGGLLAPRRRESGPARVVPSGRARFTEAREVVPVRRRLRSPVNRG